MISPFDKTDECCGCTACVGICPAKAIVMEADEEGFLYPKINSEKCIDCGLCKKICAFQNREKSTSAKKYPLVYGAKHLNYEARASSSSGGAFTALSDYVLNTGGVIFGAAFDDNFRVVHKCAYTADERNAMRGSKYVQSDMGDTFSQIKRLLKNNNTVLFTGTPCQCGGLKSFLNATNCNTENLILCDIVCHGVPSPLFWDEHINSLKKKFGNDIKNYFFRSKVLGWHTHTEAVENRHGKLKYKSSFIQKHKHLFYSHYMLRPSCYNCGYTSFDRCSDITIADFWGIENCNPEFDDNKGVSLILVNSPKGEMIFNAVKKDFLYIESDSQKCMQNNLKQPSSKPKDRPRFWNDYFTKGYKYTAKKYAQIGFKHKVKGLIIKVAVKLKIIKFLVKIKKKIKG